MKAIVCGDCLDVMAGLADNSVDLICTDPPYGSGGRDGSVHRSQTFGDRMSAASHIWFTREWAKELFRITTNDVHAYVFSDWRKHIDVKIAFETAGWECRSLLVWDKGIGLGEYWRSCHEFILWMTKRHPRKLTHGGCFNVLRYPPVPHKERLCATQKPEALIAFLIEASSQERDLVGDFFLGSGTTAVAAQRLKRRFIGCDIDPDCVQTTLRRLGGPFEVETKEGVSIRQEGLFQ